ncbi:unnamed protein product [Rhodiola kirilowii]
MFTAVILLAVLFMFGFMSTAHYYVDVKRVKGWFFAAASANKSTQKVKLIEKDAELEEVEVEAVIVKTRKDEVKRNIFATFDKNGDGYVTREELREAMKGAGMVMRESEIEEMVEKMDVNGDGLIDLGEFCESIEMDGIGEEADDEGGLREAFNVFDGNKDGVISVEELGKVLVSLGLKQGFKMEDCVEMIRKVDVDGDGGIDFGEFKKMMRAGGSLLIGSSFPSH